jgi:phosphotransferase system enzyme I (PtsI)/phosphotransferase system enzyme I (PtsP)
LSTRPPSPSLSLLREIVVEASRSTSLEEQIDCVVRKVHEAMHAEVCSLYLSDADQELVLLATVGLDRRVAGRLRLQMGEGLVGTIASRQLAIRLEKASAHPAYRYFPETGEEAFEAFLGVPIVHLGRTLGVLVLQDRAPRVFGDADEAFLYTVATQLASSLLRWSKAPPAHRPAFGRERRLTGTRGAPGVAVGRLHLVHNELALAAIDEQDSDPQRELERLGAAVERTLQGLDSAVEQLRSSVAPDVLEVFEFYKLMLSDEKLVAVTRHRILSGHSAAGAIRTAVEETANAFASLDDPYFRARAEDVHHLGDRLFKALSGDGPELPDDRTDVVLIGKLVSVADIAHYRPDRLAGIVSMEGSPFSHTAVLANALGIPAVVNTGDIADLFEGETVALDGYHGIVTLEPGRVLLSEYGALIEQEKLLQAGFLALRDDPAVTLDGFRVALLANTGLLADATPGLERGAEGIGLYRSEIPFMIRSDFPSEDEQADIYGQILGIYAPRPVSMRTLDVGGDKPLPYLQFEEENPGLGWRGIRFTLDNKAIFLTQLRAMLRANLGRGNLRVLLPMVTRVDEVTASLELLDAAIEQLRQAGLETSRPPVGVMVEAPAAAALLDLLAPHIDFVSIGSNDLSQYVLAVDRNNPRVASRFDHLHPAVLRTIAGVVTEARRLGLAVGLCGEMASDPLAVVALLGMGVDTLSMSSFNLPRIKYLIRHLRLDGARACLADLLRLGDEKAVRGRAAEELRARGVGQLVAGV